jgi:signal transduction histidine kinase
LLEISSDSPACSPSAITGTRPAVRVSDDGGGAAVPRAGGLGIIGMRERVELTGGRLSAAPGPRGFVVEAILPLPSGGGES